MVRKNHTQQTTHTSVTSTIIKWVPVLPLAAAGVVGPIDQFVEQPETKAQVALLVLHHGIGSAGSVLTLSLPLALHAALLLPLPHGLAHSLGVVIIIMVAPMAEYRGIAAMSMVYFVLLGRRLDHHQSGGLCVLALTLLVLLPLAALLLLVFLALATAAAGFLQGTSRRFVAVLEFNEFHT